MAPHINITPQSRAGRMVAASSPGTLETAGSPCPTTRTCGRALAAATVCTPTSMLLLLWYSLVLA